MSALCLAVPLRIIVVRFDVACMAPCVEVLRGKEFLRKRESKEMAREREREGDRQRQTQRERERERERGGASDVKPSVSGSHCHCIV